MSLINNQQKMLDIVFANRNKSYGAYAIRSAYGNTLFKSLFIVFFTVISSLGLITWLKGNQAEAVETGQITDKDSLRIIPFIIPEKKVEQTVASNTKNTKSGGEKSTSQNATVINNNAIDTAKQVVNTDLHPINTNTNSGIESPNTGSTSLASTGNGTSTNTNPANPFEVDESPVFEGGHDALLAFVRKNLVYPNIAVNEGKQGTLYVKFVVDESGKISNILLQNNLGFGLDDEAMRVVKMIPKFKSPGKIKGQAVKTYYQIPIKFKLG